MAKIFSFARAYFGSKINIGPELKMHQFKFHPGLENQGLRGSSIG